MKASERARHGQLRRARRATTSTGRPRSATRRARRTIFEVDPDKPFGLGKLKYQYESDAAKEYEFKKADI